MGSKDMNERLLNSKGRGRKRKSLLYVAWFLRSFFGYE